MMNEELNFLRENNNFRSIKNIERKDGKYIFVGGKKLLNLSSNDYLNIGNNSDLRREFFEKYYRWEDFSSSSSRLLTGNEPIYFELEKLLANLFHKDRALLFNSGYSANLGILSAILTKNDVIFSDKLNHASIIDGIALGGAKMIRYNHLNYEQLEKFLANERSKYKQSIIISEALFSMDGDLANISKLVELKQKYNSILIVDESHSFGVYGNNGLGYCEECKIIDDVDIIMAGFGKGCGSFGAFCVANNSTIDYLINRARSFIFSTALPPINIAWTKFIIENIFPKYENKRKKLLETAKKFNNELKNIGFNNSSESFIVPIILNTEEQIKKIQDKLMENGYFVLPIRYPTVPKNSPRFRLSLTADIDYEELEKLLKTIK